MRLGSNGRSSDARASVISGGLGCDSRGSDFNSSALEDLEVLENVPLTDDRAFGHFQQWAAYLNSLRLTSNQRLRQDPAIEDTELTCCDCKWRFNLISKVSQHLQDARAIQAGRLSSVVVSTQRSLYKSGKLPEEHARGLNEIGFDWDFFG